MVNNTKIYLNLTNGIEFVNNFPNASFVRIQSSHCEVKAYNEMLKQLDSDFLMNLAVGTNCIVIDASNTNRVSKSLRLGLSVIYYIIYRIWFDKFVRIYTLDDIHLDNIFKLLDKSCYKKIRYFKKFCLGNSINLSYINFKTTRDGDIDFYKGKISNLYNNQITYSVSSIQDNIVPVTHTKEFNKAKFFCYIKEWNNRQIKRIKEMERQNGII